MLTCKSEIISTTIIQYSIPYYTVQYCIQLLITVFDYTPLRMLLLVVGTKAGIPDHVIKLLSSPRTTITCSVSCS